jgi:hypothetical protein
MKKNISFLFGISLIFTLSGCGEIETPIGSVQTSTPFSIPATEVNLLPTPTPLGKTIIVTSMADSGSGTLRQALLDAQSGDTISFDTAIFSPNDPKVIDVQTPLPGITQGNVTVDASNAGVILNGSKIPDGWNSGLSAHSNNNIIRGLQVVGFSGAGIVIDFGQNNLVENNISYGNDYGIGLWGLETANNSISSNLVGIMADGVTARGNRSSGIIIMEGSHGNTIGPDNHIAFNGNTGIEILGPESLGNSISQNSIHNNGKGIVLSDGGDAEIKAPTILSFNLQVGTLDGATCSGCTVEIFSDNSDEGAIFEGRITADSDGNYAFKKGESLTGPYLTAIAIDQNNNTSPFSIPTFGTSRSLVIQDGNKSLRTILQTKPTYELADNRIGSVGMCDKSLPLGQTQDLLSSMDQVVDLGIKHFRFTIVCIDFENVDWDQSEFTFDERQNEFLTQMTNNGVMVTYLLTFRDDALGGEGRPIHSRFQAEAEINRFLDYLHFIIPHIKDKVAIYEIWNEPNIKDSVQWIEPDDYINLVRRAVPVIRQEDPQAKIMLAGTTYLRDLDSREYLFRIFNSDILPLVDVISWHPFYAASPEFESEYYYEYPSIIQQIKDTARAHGFQGEYLAGEITWWTAEESGAKDWGIWYSDIAAAKYHARSIMMHLGMDVGVNNNSTPSAFASRRIADNTISNLCTVMAGTRTIDIPLEFDREIANLQSYSFETTDGDILIAFWTDGIAVDDDPGITATLTLSNSSVGEAVGIDILYGFEQQIQANIENGNIVLSNILVKDYPIILRLENFSTP